MLSLGIMGFSLECGTLSTEKKLLPFEDLKEKRTNEKCQGHFKKVF